MKLLLLTSLGLVACLLAACGGGSDVEPLPMADATVPASALASSDAFSRYVGSLAADDRGEPVSLDRLVPPTADQADPIDG